MNRGLLLLLVATLYTLGCVQGVHITLADAQTAVTRALGLLNTGRVGDMYMPPMRLQNTNGYMNYKITGMYFNCGLRPNGRFYFPESRGLQMCAFIRSQRSLTNIKCYRPMYKANLGGWFINLVGDRNVGGHRRRFNFHLQVDHNAKSTKEQLMDLLLSREME